MIDVPLSHDATGRHWPAELLLGLTGNSHSRKTLLSDMSFKGPLRVQRPFYPEDPGIIDTPYFNPCHLYLLHPPGGIVSGDELVTRLSASNKAHGVLTTPSATKFYQADDENHPQKVSNLLQFKQSAGEWLPQETIVFDGAHAHINTQIYLDDSPFIGWETICFGRRANQLPFLKGSFEQAMNVYVNKQLKFRDRLSLKPEMHRDQLDLLNKPYGLNGFSVCSLFIAHHHSPNVLMTELIDTARGVWEPSENSQHEFKAITEYNGLLIGRYLGHCSEQANLQLRSLWQALRPMIFSRQAVAPRIWST